VLALAAPARRWLKATDVEGAVSGMQNGTANIVSSCKTAKGSNRWPFPQAFIYPFCW